MNPQMAKPLPQNVNPELVMLARKARGLTQSQFASAMEVSQGTVSKIEAGINYPTEQEFENLADALDFPLHFFTQNRRIPGPGMSEHFHHRKRKKVGAKTLSRVEANATVQIMNVEDLLDSWDSKSERIPTLPIEQFEGNPERIARTVRAMWQLTAGPVFNVTRTIEQFGGIILTDDFKTRYIDGFSRRALDTSPMFFLNTTLLPDRWRWTLAHELGHIVMHEDPLERPDKAIEDEADRFAGEFLAPGHELKPQLWELSFQKLPQLKRYWKISMQAILMRAKHLEVLNERQLRYMFMQLSKAGYRLREPEELDPPEESPELIERVISFHHQALGYSNEELLYSMKLRTSDLSNLYKSRGPRLRILK